MKTTWVSMRHGMFCKQRWLKWTLYIYEIVKCFVITTHGHSLYVHENNIDFFSRTRVWRYCWDRMVYRWFCASANCVSVFPLGLTFAGPARPIHGRLPHSSSQVADTRPEWSKKQQCRPIRLRQFYRCLDALLVT